MRNTSLTMVECGSRTIALPEIAENRSWSMTFSGITHDVKSGAHWANSLASTGFES
jgi:hypothetical protein